LIECTELVKTFQAVGRPPVRALDGLSLSVERGEVVGVAGPNGAGKSTLIALLLGYLHPTSGGVLLDAMPPRRYVESRGVGYLSELIGINPRWRTDQALERFALLAGLSDADVVKRVDELMELLGLDEHRKKPVKALSKGNLQRLGVAQALLGDPDLIILDEPTHGFDPMWTLRFRRVIADLRRPGRTMLIASHDLSELQALTDRVVILDHGRVVRTVETTAKAPVLRDYRLAVAAGADSVAAIFPGARALGDRVFEMRQIELAALNAGLAEFLRRGGHIVSVGPSETLLEYHFRDAVEELNP
jgi:ABC-2 type transport system ATP-binding protein